MTFKSNQKKVLTILSLIIISVSIIGIYIYHKNRSPSYAILDAKIADNNKDKITFAKIYSNGKLKKASKIDNYSKAIEVDPDIFIDHNVRFNRIYNTVSKELLYKNKELTSNKTFIKMIKEVAKRSHHVIGILNLFDLNGAYYVYLKYNAGLSDDGRLYQYKNGELIKICKIESDQIIGLRKIEHK